MNSPLVLFQKREKKRSRKNSAENSFCIDPPAQFKSRNSRKGHSEKRRKQNVARSFSKRRRETEKKIVCHEIKKFKSYNCISKIIEKKQQKKKKILRAVCVICDCMCECEHAFKLCNCAGAMQKVIHYSWLFVLNWF